ncbi:mucin-22 [Biomphalaria glabrata]|nr:mucin-22-like [Biomphalaria glabrata]
MASSRSLVFSLRTVFVSFASLFVQLILLTRNGITANGTGSCTEIRTNVVSLDDQWRSVYNDQTSAKEHCDEGNLKLDTWYSFSKTEDNEIPTECVKNHACGTRVGMWLDLSGQPITEDGSIVQAHLCGAYNVLGKYDCCVLRTPVSVKKCSGKFIYKLHKPIDRCPVAVCTKGINETLNDTVKAVAGAIYTEDTSTGTTNLLVTEASTSGLEMSETSSIGETTNQASSGDTANTATSDGNTTETSSVDFTSDVSSNGTIDTSSVDVTSEVSSDRTTTETAPVDVTNQSSSVDGSTKVSSDETSIEPPSTGTTNETSTDGALPVGSSEGLTSKASSDGTTIAANNEGTTIKMTSDFETTQTSSVSSFSSNEISDSVIAEESTTDHAISSKEASGTFYESTESPSYSSSTPATSFSDESQSDSTDSTAEVSSESTSEMTSGVTGALQDSTLYMSTDDIAPQKFIQQSTAETVTSTTDIPPPMPAENESTDKTSTETIVSTQYESDVTENFTFLGETSKQASESPLPVSAGEISTDIPEMSSTQESSTGMDLLTTDDSIPSSSEASSTDQSGDEKAPETEATSGVISTSTTTTQGVITSIMPTKASTEKSTTSSIHDVIMVEHIKLIFRSPAPNVTVHLVHLMPSFFRRAENDSIHRNMKACFNMTIPSENDEPCYLNRTCVTVKITSSGGEGIIGVFDRLDLIAFMDNNSKYKLIGYCRKSEDCEYKEETPKIQASQTSFEKNAPIFITVIALCVVCLAVIIVGVICTRVWRRGTYHAGDNVERAGTAEDDHHHVTATPSPFTDEQIMKDELVTSKPDIAEKGSSNGSALDGGESTWVIPLDDAPAPELPPINCEDTKL